MVRYDALKFAILIPIRFLLRLLPFSSLFLPAYTEWMAFERWGMNNFKIGKVAISRR